MSRRFNFTGRARILREDVRVSVSRRDSSLVCRVHLWLSEYNLRPDAEVVVEAERARVLRIRHAWGMAGLAFGADGASSEFDLAALGDADDVRFRILVVEPGTCRLLAAADGIVARNDDDSQAPQRALLPIIMQDLYGGVWELQMGNPPTLILDSRLGTKQELKSSPVLMAILPGVVRAILINLAHENDGAGEDDEAVGEGGGESEVWLELGQKWAGDACPSGASHQDVDEWAQRAVTGFCKDRGLRDRLAKFMCQED